MLYRFSISEDSQELAWLDKLPYSIQKELEDFIIENDFTGFINEEPSLSIQFRHLMTPFSLLLILKDGLSYHNICLWLTMELGVYDASEKVEEQERMIVGCLAQRYWMQLTESERVKVAGEFGFANYGVQTAESFFLYHNVKAGIELALRYLEGNKVKSKRVCIPYVLGYMPHVKFLELTVGLFCYLLQLPIQIRLMAFLLMLKMRVYHSSKAIL